MTPEQIIQQWRARREYLTRLRQSNYEAVVHLADAEVVADAYEAQARKLAEVEAERDALKAERDHERHEKETVFDASHAMIRHLRSERDALKAEKAAAIAVLVSPTNQNGINGDLVACAKDVKQAHTTEAETADLALKELDALKAKVGVFMGSLGQRAEQKYRFSHGDDLTMAEGAVYEFLEREVAAILKGDQ